MSLTGKVTGISLSFSKQGIRLQKIQQLNTFRKCSKSGLIFDSMLFPFHGVLCCLTLPKFVWPWLCCICQGSKRKGIFIHSFSRVLQDRGAWAPLSSQKIMLSHLGLLANHPFPRNMVWLASIVIYLLAAWRSIEPHLALITRLKIYIKKQTIECDVMSTFLVNL